MLVYTGKAWQWFGVFDVLKLLGFACLSNEWCSLLQATGECTTFAHWVLYPTDAVLQCKESVCMYFVSVAYMHPYLRTRAVADFQGSRRRAAVTAADPAL